MYKYKCYTTLGNWTFYADNDHEAMRLALYYCYRDNEGFLYVERVGKGYTLSIALIENNHIMRTT